MRINQVVNTKPQDGVVTISPDASIRELIGLLGQYNIGALVVSSDGESVEGIVSERDVVRRMLEDESVLERPVNSIMTAQVHTCEPDHSVDELMAVMTERRIRHVPVVVDGKLTGIVSIGDIVKNRISQLEFERDQLDSFVAQNQF